jgi:hypothetical protein
MTTAARIATNAIALPTAIPAIAPPDKLWLSVFAGVITDEVVVS